MKIKTGLLHRENKKIIVPGTDETIEFVNGIADVTPTQAERLIDSDDTYSVLTEEELAKIKNFQENVQKADTEKEKYLKTFAENEELKLAKIELKKQIEILDSQILKLTEQVKASSPSIEIKSDPITNTKEVSELVKGLNGKTIVELAKYCEDLKFPKAEYDSFKVKKEFVDYIVEKANK